MKKIFFIATLAMFSLATRVEAYNSVKAANPQPNYGADHYEYECVNTWISPNYDKIKYTFEIMPYFKNGEKDARGLFFTEYTKEM